METWKNYSAIDVIVVMINKVEKIENQKKLRDVLSIDIKGAFHHVFWVKFIQQIVELNIDIGFLRWT